MTATVASLIGSGDDMSTSLFPRLEAQLNETEKGYTSILLQ